MQFAPKESAKLPSASEIEGYQQTLKLLIEKKNYFQNELVKESNPDAKFSLHKRLETLENEIGDLQQKLAQK